MSWNFASSYEPKHCCQQVPFAETHIHDISLAAGDNVLPNVLGIVEDQTGTNISAYSRSSSHILMRPILLPSLSAVRAEQKSTKPVVLTLGFQFCACQYPAVS